MTAQQDLAMTLHRRMIRMAAVRDVAHTLTEEELRELLRPMRCAVTGLKLTWKWEGEGDNPWEPAIDRMSLKKGYVPGNVRIVCKAFVHFRNGWDDATCRRLMQAMMKQGG
jgi:hypothetical protein